uniref:receptor-like protein EIX2 n=1 Tax=Erigeron canadensis TaxID=72917 RepID=UPI001CB941F7|nr:receptor-like protein EIX2 [Erigeron canadensis]
MRSDKERQSLLDFKAGLQDPFDHNCIAAWGTTGKEDVDDDDCCNWWGIACNNQTGHVTELQLNGCGLKGEISPSLLDLTYLTHLYLSDNHFNGSLPNSIGSLLTQLTHLEVSWNSLSGTIPNSIGSLTQLVYLDLSGNSFSGSILESICSLNKLRELRLYDNSFNGTIPNCIGSLTELTYLNLYSNSFSGNIPEAIGSLTELTYLDLSNNSLSGNIPQEFGNIVKLEKLYLNKLGRCSVEDITWLSRLSHLEILYMNGISLAKADHWVDAILSLQNLTFLSLDGCDLSQVTHPYSFSSSHVNSSSSSSSSSSNIRYLDLRNNNLNSSTYLWLYPLTTNNLYTLDLSGNKLDQIPTYLGNLCNLTRLFFDNNSALVTFSDFLKTLSGGCTSSALYHLNASSSQFTGSISDDIQNFLSLGQLYLAHNQLNGTISDKMRELPMLQRLDISSNSLRGTVIEKLGKSRLKYINFSVNNFSGKASDLLSAFNGSSVLDLSSNNFYGLVTKVSSTLNVLNLSQNKFYGGISFLCQTVDWHLNYLDLSYNSFYGQIPDCLWHLKELKVLNLAHNNLFGRLPASIEYLIQLEVLYLYNNNFSGEVPLSLRNFTKLAFLDLGANKFSNNMPDWIGENLLGLYVLSLGSNDFFGPIPSQFCQLANLQILDLSANNLNGTIPSCINNLTSMVQRGSLSAHNIHIYEIFETGSSYETDDYTDRAIVQWQGIRREFMTNTLRLLKMIDLSSNNLKGQIPNKVTDLHGLVALNLSKNALCGEIPHKIGEMNDLLTLDISRNHFSGGIPSSISEMTLLNFLNVSYNNLSGRIPSGTQLQTFNATSYTGNAKLCGLPLSKYCPGDKELRVPSPIGESDKDESDRRFYIGGAVGFAIGFWTVCVTLLVIRRGRHTFFHFMDTLENLVYVKVLVFKAKF